MQENGLEIRSVFRFCAVVSFYFIILTKRKPNIFEIFRILQDIFLFQFSLFKVFGQIAFFASAFWLRLFASQLIQEMSLASNRFKRPNIKKAAADRTAGL